MMFFSLRFMAAIHRFMVTQILVMCTYSRHIKTSQLLTLNVSMLLSTWNHDFCIFVPCQNCKYSNCNSVKVNCVIILSTVVSYYELNIKYKLSEFKWKKRRRYLSPHQWMIKRPELLRMYWESAVMPTLSWLLSSFICNVIWAIIFSIVLMWAVKEMKGQKKGYWVQIIL